MKTNNQPDIPIINQSDTPIVPERHMYRYNEVGFMGKKYLAKKSCKGCYGTGIYGYKCEGKLIKKPGSNKHDYEYKRPIICTCLLDLEGETNANQEK